MVPAQTVRFSLQCSPHDDSGSTLRKAFLPAVLVFLLVASLTSCGRANEAAEPQSEEAQVTVTAEPLSVPTLVPEALVVQPLLVWLPDEITRFVAEDAYAPFESLLHEYAETPAGNRIYLRIKAAEDDGGILPQLSNAQEVAPAAVPDVLLMHGNDMLNAMAEGRLHEWLELPEEAIADIPTVLLAKGEMDGQFYGIPFRFSLIHLHHRFAEPANEMVFSYAEILERHTPIVLPMQDDSFLRKLLLAQLFDAEEIRSEEPTAEEWIVALEEIFGFYELATAQGLFAAAPDDARAESAAFIQSDDYLIARAEDARNLFAPIPNRRGTELAVTDTWFWVLPKSDPARRQMAQEFVLWIMDDYRPADVEQPFAAFPARASHFLTEPQDDYLQFVHAAISRAKEPIDMDVPFVDLMLRNFQAILRGEMSSADSLSEIETFLLGRN